MLPPQSDANVLYGLLALQLGLVTRDAALASLAEWAADRSRGVDAILLGRGEIGEQAHALLGPLVGAGHCRNDPPNGDRTVTIAKSPPPGGWPWPVEARGDAALADGGGPIPTASVAVGLASDADGARFRFLRPHNEGGLGVISVALDRELGRQVALKEIKLRYADEPESRARFLLEAEVTGKLEHPGIVPVYGLGAYPDGRPYYAMRLVRGETLSEAIDRLHKDGRSVFDPVRRSLSSRQLLERFLDVCDTVEYAHSRGVIHRDLKPDNVMLGPFGETLLLDWGLARPLGSRLSDDGTAEPPIRTSEAAFASDVEGSPTGTPRYMSPEQARGEVDTLGAATDVYGLGAILYHMLAGEPPLRGARGGEIFRLVEQGKIPPLREINRRIPRALEAVCSKAMAPRPEDRYPSARSIAEDLRRWLADEPVSARPESPAARLGRWGRRNRSTVRALAAALVLVAAASTILAFWSGIVAGRERLARGEARLAQRRAERARAEAVAASRLAEASHRQVLRDTSRFAADTIAREVKAIARVLNTQASESGTAEVLRAAVESAGEVERAELQAWMDGVYRQYFGTIIASNWFITGPDGTQLARAPYADSVGRDFSYRDYYHGLGHDLEPEESERLRSQGELPIIDAFHQSPVYRSTATGNPMVTFSVPVVGTDGGPLGILAISVEVGRFDVLQTEPGSDLVASLVETRPDSSGRAGLILQHPWLAGFRDHPPRIYQDEAHVSRFAELIRSVGATLPIGSPLRPDGHTAVELGYRDPIGREYDGTWTATAHPVIADGPDGPWKTGWVVVVQGRSGAEADPVGDGPDAH